MFALYRCKPGKSKISKQKSHKSVVFQYLKVTRRTGTYITTAASSFINAPQLTPHVRHHCHCLVTRRTGTYITTAASSFINAPQLTPHVRHHSHCLPFRTRQLCLHAELLTTQHWQRGAVFLQTF